MCHRGYGRGGRPCLKQGRVLLLSPTGVCRCRLGIVQHRISGGNTVKCHMRAALLVRIDRATLTFNPHSYTTRMYTYMHRTQTHLCVVLIKVDKITRIASSLANIISWSSAPTHTQLMTQFAVTAIFVVVVRTSCHTLSVIVASNAVISCIVDYPEVATCFALKQALCAERMTD